MNIANIFKIKNNINEVDVTQFINSGNSYVKYTNKIHIEKFRHISDLTINFNHPITAIAGTNKSGKTSILLLIACVHEKFMRPDASSTAIGVREHGWSDVLSFTSHETISSDYIFNLSWRVAGNFFNGTAKRLKGSRAWSGLGKKTSDKNRINAKIKDREVRLTDLERVLPARAFSDSLFRKSNSSNSIPLHQDIVQAFSYIFAVPVLSISEVGKHLNRRCFLITNPNGTYSTYNAASGEEAVIYILKDLIESPKNSLILIEEIEVGIHPSVLRRLIEILHIVSWDDKKQIIFTTHSPTALSSVDPKSRKFIEKNGANYECINNISIQSAMSKMDSIAHPLINLYCEDDVAKYMINQQIIALQANSPNLSSLINIVTSGPANEVKNDYLRHKRNYPQYRIQIGFAAIFDGDYFYDQNYQEFVCNAENITSFIFPYEKPEKFLVRSYLNSYPNGQLESDLNFIDHHLLFERMVNYGLANSKEDALHKCYTEFSKSPEYQKHSEDIVDLINMAIGSFS